ncbi:MAG: UvrB/UvrC motif-containing protein [Candidatus Paceibacterota bacterium]
MKIQDLKKLRIPDKSGVYFFLKSARQGLAEKNILYIGKATSLRDRVKSYFSKDLINTRGPAILDMTVRADNIEWQETDSVLEALILEANLIKKYKPKYNTKEKDNKSFNYVCINKDVPSKILVVRGRNLDKSLYKNIFGPFPNGNLLKEGMKIIRRIFPYFDYDSNKKNNKEFYRQIGLVPKNEYNENIKNIKLLFQGKKKSIIKNLKARMTYFSKLKDFENAARIRDQIYALNHINDISLIKDEIYGSPTSIYRIEAYDVAHMSGKNMVGVMTVVEGEEVNKNEYRKFIIRTQNDANDTGALEEIISRRLRHTEWGLPNLIVVDGSIAQVNVAKRVLGRYQFDIPIVGVVKDEHHRPKAIMGDEKIIKAYKKEILLANNEAHRFAITFHKQKRNKSFLK